MFQPPSCGGWGVRLEHNSRAGVKCGEQAAFNPRNALFKHLAVRIGHVWKISYKRGVPI